MPDTEENAAAFGRPQSNHGPGALRTLRFVSLVENGTHVLFGACQGPYTIGEVTLAHKALPSLRPGMLCLADRYFAGYALLKRALDTTAEVLWRVRINANLPCVKRLPDGSYLSYVRHPKQHSKTAPRVQVRVIEYRLTGVLDAEPVYRLITSILDPDQAPAHE